MEICERCGAETQLYFNGIPICIACSPASDESPKPISNDVQLSLPHE
jgi:hypothetical protein